MKLSMYVDGRRVRVQRADLGRALHRWKGHKINVYLKPENEEEIRQRQEEARAEKAQYVALMQARSWRRSKDKRFNRDKEDFRYGRGD